MRIGLERERWSLGTTVASLVVGALIVVTGVGLYRSLGSGVEEAPPEEPNESYRVRRLPPGHGITLDDRALKDWPASLIVMRMSAQDASELQWKSIRGRTPETVGPADAAITVYMARDADFWYVAVDVQDDKTLEGQPEYPYTGDCVEIFVAGTEPQSERDFQTHVEQSARGGQAAFFQLELGPGASDRRWDHLPAWRTDRAFRTSAIAGGFRASAWRTASGWSAEAVIPFGAFAPEVRRRLERGEALRMNIDYLDYDSRTARHTQSDHWGFLPDNVFALDRAEANVNRPRYMRRVTFD